MGGAVGKQPPSIYLRPQKCADSRQPSPLIYRNSGTNKDPAAAAALANNAMPAKKTVTMSMLGNGEDDDDDDQENASATIAALSRTASPLLPSH